MEIGGTTIKKLSGPVTFHLLQPKKKLFNKYGEIYLPIVMLFGDYHMTYEGFCKEKGSEIYSDRFLKALNSIATKERPIDFNVEFYFAWEEYRVAESKQTLSGAEKVEEYWKETQFKKVIEDKPIWKFRENTKMCYFRKIKHTTSCPAPNIRWHYVDIRSAHTNTKYNFEGRFNNFTYFQEYKNPNVRRLYTTNEINNYMHMIGLILNDLEKKETTFMDFYLNHEKFVNNSLIYKQLRKQSSPLDDINQWKEWYIEYYLYIIRGLYVPPANYKIYQQYLTLYSTNDWTKINDFIQKNEAVMSRNILNYANSHFLDMYYLSRMFKIPAGDINPVLSTAYLGSYHTRNIQYFLTNIMKTYEVVYDIENISLGKNVIEPNDKCITFPNFNLDNMIDEYQELRKKKGIQSAKGQSISSPEQKHVGLIKKKPIAEEKVEISKTLPVKSFKKTLIGKEKEEEKEEEKQEEKVKKSPRIKQISKTLPMKSPKRKSQWEKYGTGIFLEEPDPVKKGAMDRIYLIDIDRGLAWNPMGKQYSKTGKGTGWVWAHPDEDVIIDYINSLYDEEWEDEEKIKKGKIVITKTVKRKGNIPVFISESQSKDTQQAVLEMCADLEHQPLIILGLPIDEAYELAFELYNNSELMMYRSDECTVISIPTLSDSIEGIELSDLEITPQYNDPDPAPFKLGILIGQQASGKSSYSEYLQSIGYIIIDEKEAGKIRNRSTKKAIKQFEEQIDEVLECKKKKKASPKKKLDCPKGIIIDATNPSEESRQTYNEIAEEKGIKVVNLWLSKSGFDYNSKREDPVSKIALNKYASKFELPEEYVRVL